MEILKHIYFSAGREVWEEKANHILELYYQQNIRKELDKKEKKLLEESNYRYNYEHYLENLNKSGYHL